MKGRWAKKQAKLKRNLSESAQKPNLAKERTDKSARRSEPEDNLVNLNQSLDFTVSTSLLVCYCQIKSLKQAPDVGFKLLLTTNFSLSNIK